MGAKGGRWDGEAGSGTWEPLPLPGPIVDEYGAGDSFAAGLAFGYLQDAHIVKAAQYGNAMGAQRCTGSTLDVYLSLPRTNKQLADTYGTAFEG
jgi:adenosine kinase